MRKDATHGRYSTHSFLVTLTTITLKTAPETIHAATAITCPFLSHSLNTTCLRPPLSLLLHLRPHRLGRVQRVVSVHQHANRQHRLPRPRRLQPAAVEAVRLGQEPREHRLLLRRLRVL